MLSIFNCRLALFLGILTVSIDPFATEVLAQENSFSQWKQQVSIDLYQRGIAKNILRQTFSQLTLDQEVIALDRQQPEFRVTFGAYLKKRLTIKRVARARKEWLKHGEILSAVQQKYGIPIPIMLAFWSLETNYGDYMGNKNIIRSLMTLAYDGRRKKLFTNQLYYALDILQRHPYIRFEHLVGSWAGAMGHPQFMPSTFIEYAVDGDGDGQIDLYNSLKDVFYSMGKYLSTLSWDSDKRWGQEIVLPSNIDWSKTGLEWSLPVAQWIRQGVEPVDGQMPSNRFQHKASLLLPMGSDGPAFLVYDNFRVIMRWNNSVNYALSVGILADLIAQRYYLANLPLHNWIKDYPTPAMIKKLQRRLNHLGYQAGAIDGLIGKQTRRSIVRYQLDHKLTPDGYPNQKTLRQLNIQQK